MQSNDAAFVQTIAKSARVARLFTIDIENMPHTVPVVFAFIGHHYLHTTGKEKENTTS